MKGLILFCKILYFINFGVKAQDVTTTTNKPSSDQTSNELTTESVKVSRYNCTDEKVLKLSSNDSLETYVKECPSTKKIDVIGVTTERDTFNVSRSLDPSDNVQIDLRYISIVHFEDDECSSKINFSLTEVEEYHIPKKMYDGGCVTHDKKNTIIVFMRDAKPLQSNEHEPSTTEDPITKHTTTKKPTFEPTILASGAGHGYRDKSPPSSDKSVVTSLAAVIAVMSVAMVSLIFYAFCYKSPVAGRKLQETKRSITIEPATELQARRPTILLETHKTIAEEAREASVKQKIRRNNSIKMLEKEKKVAKKVEVEDQGQAKDTPSEHLIQIESDAEEIRCISKVLETSAQVHASDNIESTAMPELVSGTPDPKDTKEPNFELAQVTPLQTPITEETKIKMDMSEDEASNVHLGNVLGSRLSDPTSEEDKKADENKRSSRIPVPVHSSRTSSSESITSNKKSSKDTKNVS